LIVLWLMLLVVLNLLPAAWFLANRAWGIEEELVQGYRWYWNQRYRAIRKIETKDPTRALQRFEALLADMGPAQLRETTGRLRQDVLLEISRLELVSGHPKRAMRAALQVTRTDPKDYRGWVALGDARWAHKKKRDAVTAYQRALEMNPNLEHAVQRVMEDRTDHADWDGVMAAFERYRNAVWSLPVGLWFTDSWPRFDAGRRVLIPVLADGQRHVWRVHPGHPRAVGAFVFSKMGAIAGLSLSPGPGVVVELHGLRFLPAREDFESPPEPVLQVNAVGAWKAGRDLLPLGTGRWLVRSGDRRLRIPVSIPQPSRVATIELDMTVSKPVHEATVQLLRWATRNLGRPGYADELLDGMTVLPEPEPPQEESGGPAFNRDRKLSSPGSPALSIAVAGHVRRGPKDDPPLLTALIAALPEISLRDRALVLTGDTVWEGTSARLGRLDRLLRDPLGIPLFIAPGNHDLFDGRPGAARRRFMERFGPLWSIERLGGTLLIVLDTEDPPGDIGPEQLRIVLGALENAGRSSQVRTVVVCMHRVLWFLGDPRYAAVARRANQSSRPGSPGNGEARQFMATLLPELNDLARTKPVTVIAGDVGTRIPLVYDRRSGVVLIASGNRAQDPPAWWNHYLRVHLDGDRVRVEAVSLGTAPLGPVERYTPKFWAAHPGKLKPPPEAGP